MNKQTTYLITKQFTSGILAGQTWTGTTTVTFTLGKQYKSCAGGSDYIVTAISIA